MKFPEGFMRVEEYRNNLILAALLKIDQLKRMSLASRSLAEVIKPFSEIEAYVGLVNELAYQAAGNLDSEIIAETMLIEMEDSPVTAQEIADILNKPIGSALLMI